MKERALTARQTEVLSYVYAYRLEKKMSPTLDEISRAMGCSRVSAYEHVDKLVARGVVTKTKHRQRSLLLTPAGRSLVASRPSPLLARAEEERDRFRGLLVRALELLPNTASTGTDDDRNLEKLYEDARTALGDWDDSQAVPA